MPYQQNLLTLKLYIDAGVVEAVDVDIANQTAHYSYKDLKPTSEESETIRHAFGTIASILRLPDPFNN